LVVAVTATPFPVTADEATALRSLQVVVWWCRLVVERQRGGVFPLGDDPDLTPEEQAYVDAHVQAVVEQRGDEDVVLLWQTWQRAGLPPLEESVRYRA